MLKTITALQLCERSVVEIFSMWMTYTGYIELNKVRRITRAPHSEHGCPINFKMLAINNGGYNSLPVLFAAVMAIATGGGARGGEGRGRGGRGWGEEEETWAAVRLWNWGSTNSERVPLKKKAPSKRNLKVITISLYMIQDTASATCFAIVCVSSSKIMTFARSHWNLIMRSYYEISNWDGGFKHNNPMKE